MHCQDCTNTLLLAEGDPGLEAIRRQIKHSWRKNYRVSDADREVLDDLKRQIKSAHHQKLRASLRATHAQVRLESALDHRLRRALGRAKRSIVDAVNDAARTGGLDGLRSLSREKMNHWLINQGFGDSILDLTSAEAETLKNVEDLLLSSSDGFDPLELGGIGRALGRGAADAETVGAIFDDVILPDSQRAVRDALASARFLDDSSQVISTLDAQLRSSEGRQLAEARTRIASFGRELTATAAEAAGLDHYLYSGPIDGVTRSVCRQLAGKVFTRSQIEQMNNYQLAPVLTRGGGYRCRHSWSPLSESLIESANLERGTDSDVKRANQQARADS